VTATSATPRADLFRLLGDEDRLRLLALCEAEELTVGELATLLGESQPQITRKSQPLRDAGLLHARRDGTRTLLRAEGVGDAIVAAALEAGRSLCEAEGRLARVPGVVSEREETARKLFAAGKGSTGVAPDHAPVLGAAPRLPLLPMLSPLLPGHALAVDVGTGEGALLPLLSPLYDRVIAVDRSAARLARAAEQVSLLGLPNVRLREAAVDDSSLAQEIARAGGADLVVLARVLHHAARPQDLVSAAARLLRPGGHLLLVDHFPHDDESLREHGHVWLGFEPAKLRQFLEGAGLRVVALSALRSYEIPSLQVAAGQLPGGPLVTLDLDNR
jgi:DNA-binding transcriptional ArsR family regulator